MATQYTGANSKLDMDGILKSIIDESISSYISTNSTSAAAARSNLDFITTTQTYIRSDTVVFAEKVLRHNNKLTVTISPHGVTITLDGIGDNHIMISKTRLSSVGVDQAFRENLPRINDLLTLLEL